MSVLDKMRSGTDSTLMQIVLAAVLVSFVAWYGKPTGTGTNIASVNGVAIPDTDFHKLYYNLERSRMGLSDKDKEQLTEQVTQLLIRQEVELQEAARLGIEISETEVARSIFNDPRFEDENGAFDPEIYQNGLKGTGTTRSEYEGTISEEMSRTVLQQVAFLAGGITDADLRRAWIDNETKIDVSYVQIIPLRFNDDVDTSTEAVSKYISENADKIKEQYDADFDRVYNEPEKVRIRVVRLPLRDDGVSLDALKERMAGLRKLVEAGAKFEEVAQKWSEDPSAGNGGALQITPVTALDPVMQTALTGLEVGSLADVAGDADVKLIRLEERVAARVIPLGDAQDAIARRLMAERDAPILAAAYAEKLLAAWKDAGSAPQALLDEQELLVQQTGSIPAKGGASRVALPSDLLQDAARAASTGLLPKVYEQSGTYWVGSLASKEDPDMAEFEEQKDELRSQLTLVKRVELYDTYVATLVSQAKVTK